MAGMTLRIWQVAYLEHHLTRNPTRKDVRFAWCHGFTVDTLTRLTGWDE